MRGSYTANRFLYALLLKPPRLNTHPASASFRWIGGSASCSATNASSSALSRRSSSSTQLAASVPSSATFGSPPSFIEAIGVDDPRRPDVPPAALWPPRDLPRSREIRPPLDVCRSRPCDVSSTTSGTDPLRQPARVDLAPAPRKPRPPDLAAWVLSPRPAVPWVPDAI